MTVVLRLLARFADLLLGGPRVDMTARLAPYVGPGRLDYATTYSRPGGAPLVAARPGTSHSP